LRQASGRIGLRGTVVGMATSTDVRSHFAAQRNDHYLCVHAIAVAHNSCDRNEAAPSFALSGYAPSIRLLLVVNRPLTHGRMHEAMAIGVEAKTKAISKHAPQELNAEGLDFVAVASEENQRGCYRGSDSWFRELIASACTASLHPSLRPRPEVGDEVSFVCPQSHEAAFLYRRRLCGPGSIC